MSAVAGLMADPGSRSVPQGNPLRGKAILNGKGRCLGCHRVRNEGSRLGPDLTGIGLLRSPAQLEQALVKPDAADPDDDKILRVVTNSGEEIMGRLLNVNTSSVLMLDDKGDLRYFPKSDLREYTPLKSPMPSYKDQLTTQELADVVAYLASLRGVENQ
jgi:putative heme-binding domain-containing protein